MGRKLMSRGYGESRLTSTADPEEFEPVDTGIPPRQEWLLGGKPLSDHPAPHLVTWEMTDQAIAQRVQEQIERQLARGGSLSFGRDEMDKNGQARIDKFQQHKTREAQENLDYKTVLRKQHGREGHVHLYVPEDEVDKYRGADGFEPVLDKEGNPVKYMQNILTSRPKEVQAEADRLDLYQAQREMELVTGTAREAMQKQIRDNGLSPALIDADDFGLQADRIGG